MVVGDPGVVTLDRMTILADRLDEDPRIASVSVVPWIDAGAEFLRATAPAGCAVLIAEDVSTLTGEVDADANAEEVTSWARRASERGMWHDWWLSSARDIARAPEFLEMGDMDQREADDLASSRYAVLAGAGMDPNSIHLTVDATWLGPHQTGAQVLTTSAIEALAADPRIRQIDLIGIDELPHYAQHLGDIDKVELGSTQQSDVMWYPNQIDQRVDITQARSRAKRVITTYLDLIAYDIPRYHASQDAWAAYRTLQRRIPLAVDGITTISADVAHRLHEEVPRLSPDRVQAIPLGLDHITAVTSEPASDIAELRTRIEGRPFILVLGNDFQHKNRDFAIRVWEEVLSRGVNCDLVLAGLHVRTSSSKDAEAMLLAQHTNLRGEAHIVEHVASSSREWLLANAAAVVYPSSAEGFGFVPYEAAALGTPSTFTGFGPLAEISGITTVPASWSVDAFAADVAGMLADPQHAQARVEALRGAIRVYTWQRFSDEFIGFMERISALPPVEGALVGETASDASALAAVLSSKTWRATEPLRRFGSRVRRR